MRDAYDKLVVDARHNLNCAAHPILFRPGPAKRNVKSGSDGGVAASRLRGPIPSRPEISKRHSVACLGSGRVGVNRRSIPKAQQNAGKCIIVGHLKTNKELLRLETRDARLGDTRRGPIIASLGIKDRVQVARLP
jgi:hypothetical protein